MVDFFFVLSGFVIALNYMGRVKTPQDLFIFQRKRFLRLYPLHLIMLFAFAALEFAKYLVEVEFGMIANTPAFSINNMTAFFANLFLVHNWVLSTLSFNMPSWSISAEFYTYVIFGTLLLLTDSKRKMQVGILIISILLFGYILGDYGMSRWATDNITGPIRCLYSFSIGAVAYCFFEKYRDRIVLTSSIPSVVCLVLSILIVMFFASQDFKYVELIPLFFGVTILTLVLTKQNQKIHRVLSNNPTVYLGTISYGIYMIHDLTWYVYTQVLRFVFKFPSVSDSQGKVSIDIENVFVADLVTVLGIITVIILAHLSYKYVETRFNRVR